MRLLVFIAFVAAVAVQSGCGDDCKQSADIQVTVVPAAGAGSSIAKLRIGLSVAGAAPKTLEVTPPQKLDVPTPFLLRPDPPPADRYNVAVTVDAFDANGAMVATGSTSGDVVSKGCNKLTANLVAPGIVTDGGMGIADMLSPPVDMSMCGTNLGGMPDEDGDGIRDVCDNCPTDSDNGADADGDWLPDVCDPDSSRPGNRLLYFEPFSSDNGRWVAGGNFPYQGGSLIAASSSTAGFRPANGVDSLPVDVRLQMHVATTSFRVDQHDYGMYLVNQVPVSRAGTTGIRCLYVTQANASRLEIAQLANDTSMELARVPAPAHSNLPTYRMRLTQRGGSFTCELRNQDTGNTTTVTATGTAPSGPQLMSLRVTEMTAEFHSVVAQSVLP